ncbi:MAG: EAL domain-containing protein [Azonexus sp.]|jgi:EAL domain-containing protein (putative c-di-GMP-specific phosphodiesterase class I)|nr:EAL domain-containing protein [Azonexus sp.]
MTTTLADTESLIDFTRFGLSDDDLRSLNGLAPLWQKAIENVSQQVVHDPLLDAFLRMTEALPSCIADPLWQETWMRAWHDLSGRGYSTVEVLHLFFAALNECELDLIGERDNVSRVIIRLFAALRHALVAALSTVLELGEEARLEESGTPGELVALRCLRDWLAAGKAISVLSISVVNRDSFAYLSAGDLQRLPSMLVKRIAERLRPTDRVFAGREGEWLVLLPDVHTMTQPALAASQVARLFAEPLTLFSGRNIMMHCTIGAVLVPEQAPDAENALHAARLARWDASGQHQPFAWFNPRLNARWQQHYEQVAALRLALQQESLELHLQPQVDLKSGQCFGAELLLRWRNKEGHWVPPQRIVDLVEENGWQDMYTEWMLRAAMRTSADLAATGIPISLSLNLTASDFADEDLPDVLAQRLAGWELPANRFTLELTESALLADREKGLAIMRRLREQGFRLALDDFGTGYSSLSYLVSLPINEIKIDRSFVLAMFDSPEGLRMVRTIIDMANDLDMMSLAEGIEDVEQRAQLLALGCQAGQGYLYGKPISVTDFIDWYQARHQGLPPISHPCH